MVSKGLGRGLSALISEKKISISEKGGGVAANDVVVEGGQRDTVAVDNIRAGRYQQRNLFNEDEMQELADSIKVHGMVQPIIVREDKDSPDNYEIIAGERRWRASKMAGLAEIPVIIMELDDRGAMEIGLIENIQRQNLTPIEEAEGYKRLTDEFGYTQKQLGEILGKDSNQISSMVRLNRLPDEVKQYIHEGKLTAQHGRFLLSTRDPVEVARHVLKKGLNTKQTEKLVQRMSKLIGETRTKSSRDEEIKLLENQLSERIGMDITITNAGEKGSVIIKYYSLEELDKILRRLEK